jgi:D-glycero-D-manno-heptose 1,7-bisphosphate phosphatase
MRDLNKRLGGVFDDMLYAPAVPHKKDYMTKPNPGMIHHAADKHGIDLKQSIMVGDMDSDEGAAQKAGVKFVHADLFFGKPSKNEEGT